MSKWYKTDLQIASPHGGFSMANGDCSTPDAKRRAAESFVTHIKSAGIEVFAVTDHNSVDMLKDIRAAARASGLTMFPGIEVSTGTGSDSVHLLLLGDPDADIDDLKAQWMHAAGFTVDHPPFFDGEHRPAPRTFIEILDKIPENTLAIAPHVLNDNGIASERSVSDKSIKWQSLHHDRLVALDVGIPGDSEGWNSKFRARALDHFPLLKRIAFVSTSDAYRPEDLGRHCWIRMNKPSLESLRQAFLDHEARVVCDWDARFAGKNPNQIAHAYIKSIDLKNISTSSEPVSITFDPRITVIIGGRGSGKSTVIQGLRAIYGADSSLPRSIELESQKYRDEVFNAATMKSAFVEAVSGSEGIATWTSAAPVGMTSGDRPIVARVVSQKELFERTSGDRTYDASSSANMLALVDEALNDDRVAAELLDRGWDTASYRPDIFERALDERTSDFVHAATTRLEAERRISGRARIADELETAKRKLNALDDEQEKRSLAVANEMIADDRNISRFRDQLNAWKDAASALPDLTPPSLKQTNSAGALKPFKAVAQKLTDHIASAVAEIGAAIVAVESLREAADGPYAKSLQEARDLKTEYEAKLTSLGVDLSQYGSLQAQIKTAEDDLAVIDDLQARLGGLRQVESDTWVRLGELDRNRVQIREGFAQMVTTTLESLKISVHSMCDPASWKKNIHSVFGFRQGDHVDALESLAIWLWGRDVSSDERQGRLAKWRDSLLENDYSQIAASANLTNQFAARVSSRSETVRLQAAAMRADDRLEMEFLREGNDATRPESWQSVTNGSPGQRSAAMLAFILSYGDSPLILDQPEDDLDSGLVSQLIVTQFRKARWKRQLIVVTHEANIPVNTDAECVVALENSNGIIRIIGGDAGAHSGPLDDENVRKDIQDLLEGGVQAFVNRERRYDNELSQYRNDLAAMGPSSGP